jgi:SAM-dependent methyltransferase
MTEWFEEWFGEEYLHLYPHRDDADAELLVDLVARTVGLAPGARVLDVACGAGRHARAFQQRGCRTIGLDLSLPLLTRAREVAGVPVIRADMRALPVRTGAFDLTVNLFTSFGYFEQDDDHLQALQQMIATVAPRGWFVLDFLNAAWVTRALVPAETAVLAGATVRVERWLHDGGRFVMKAIAVPDGRQFVERVRLYRREELAGMITEAGGRVVHEFGSYLGAPADDAAPRTILMARLA